MRLGERLTYTSVKPNDDRCQDGQEAQHKAKVTEQLELVCFHRVGAFKKARTSLDTASRLVALFTSGFVLLALYFVRVFAPVEWEVV